jgi:hypothetical protein
VVTGIFPNEPDEQIRALGVSGAVSDTEPQEHSRQAIGVFLRNDDENCDSITSVPLTPQLAVNGNKEGAIPITFFVSIDIDIGKCPVRDGGIHRELKCHMKIIVFRVGSSGDNDVSRRRGRRGP